MIRKLKHGQSVEDFLGEWQLLAETHGDELLKRDFAASHVQKILEQKEFDKLLEDLRAIRGPDREEYETICKIIDDKTNDQNVIVASQIRLLAHLIPPTIKVKVNWKPSIPESVDSLIRIVPVSFFLIFLHSEIFFSMICSILLIINCFFVFIIF